MGLKMNVDDANTFYECALNFRNATPKKADAMWVALEACVKRLVEEACSEAYSEGRGDGYEQASMEQNE